GAFNHYHNIQVVSVDNSLRIGDALLNLWKGESYNIARFVSDGFNEKLKELLQAQHFDVIQLETLYLAPYIPTIRKYSDAVVAMRAHNVEHEIWQRVMEKTRFWPRRWYLQQLIRQLAAYEKKQLNAYDLLIPITQRDEQTFQSMGHVGQSVVTPIGIETLDYTTNYNSYKKDLSLSFIGSLDWMPNQNGLIWFLDNIWESLLRQHPNLQLHVAGRNTPQWLMNKQWKNVRFHGEIPDAADFINAHSLMIVPLLAGSGMRVKILEGMALGKVVLTTQLGLEGIPARHQQEVLVANTREEFVRAIDFCQQSNGQLIHIGQSARQFVQDNYDNLNIAARLLHTYQSMTGVKPTPSRENNQVAMNGKLRGNAFDDSPSRLRKTAKTERP
ncbi:MAG: glycosyltransferase family 4 protein, partial [Bacteroidota bacterium]